MHKDQEMKRSTQLYFHFRQHNSLHFLQVTNVHGDLVWHIWKESSRTQST